MYAIIQPEIEHKACQQRAVSKMTRKQKIWAILEGFPLIER